MAVLLRPVRPEDGPALRDAVARMEASDPGWTFAVGFRPDIDMADYARWIDGLRTGRTLPDGWMPRSYFLAWSGDALVGCLSLRHALDDGLRLYGGHIGFAVLPHHRGQGHGHAILAAGLREAAKLGLRDVLLTCSDVNVGSIRILEAAGAVLEDEVPRDDGGTTRRYWIHLHDGG